MSEVEVRDKREVQWFWSENTVVDLHGQVVGAYGIAVYMVLCRESWHNVTKTTLRQIAKKLRISPQTVMRSIDKLIECKLIRQDKKSTCPEDGPSVYTLMSATPRSQEEQVVASTVPDGNGGELEGNGAVPQGNTNKTKHTNNTKTDDSVPSRIDELVLWTWGQYIRISGKNPKTYTLTKIRRDKCKTRVNELLQIYPDDFKSVASQFRYAMERLMESEFHREKGFIEWDKHLFRSQEQLERWINTPTKAGPDKPAKKSPWEKVKAQNA